MDCTNLYDHLPGVADSSDGSFSPRWFCGIPCLDPGAGESDEPAFQDQRKGHGLDGQESEACPGIAGWNEDHKILRLGSPLP